MRAARHGVPVLFEHEHGRAFGHHEPAAPAVEREAGLQGVAGGGQGLDVGEAAEAERVNRGLGASGDDGVGLAVFDGPEGLADGVGAGRACRHDGKAGTLGAEPDGDVARTDIADEHGDEVRRYARYPFLDHDLGLVDEGLHASDAGADVYAETVGGDVGAGLKPALGHGLDGGAGGEAAEEVASPHGCGLHAHRDGIEILYASGDVDRQLSVFVHPFEGDYAAAAFLEAGAESVDIISDGRDHAHSGNYYSSFFHISEYHILKHAKIRFCLEW